MMDGTEQKWFDADLGIDEFRKLGYQVIDMMAEYYASVRDVPVFQRRNSAEVAAVFDEPLPVKGQEAAAVIGEWPKKVLPNATHIGSPRYFGFVNGSGAMIASLADALASTVNMNMGAWKASPAATEIERLVLRWIAEMAAYPVTCGGLLLSGGTMANFTAMCTALRNMAPYDTTKEGLQSGSRKGRFTVYMADHEGHISTVRAMDMLNLGRDALRRVPSGPDFKMDPAALDAMLTEDKKNGAIPFFVIANAGSINVGAVDDLPTIEKICRKHNAWFHVDGACGAFGATLPGTAHRFKGIELADSLTLDPHKWLYIPYECGCVLVKNPEKLRRAFSVTAPYLRGTLPTEYTGMDFHEYGPQMSRGFRALKVWMTIKQYGKEGYEKLHAQNVQCAAHLDTLVRASEDFEALHEPVLYIYSFRYRPARLKQEYERNPAQRPSIDAYLDGLNQRIADAIQLTGVAFVMTTSIRGRTVLRLSVCSHRTTIEDIDVVFEKLREVGKEKDDMEF